MKIGVRATTDSLTPRRLIQMRKRRMKTMNHELVGEPRRRKEAEDGVRPRRHRDRDRQHVVDDERRARDHPRSLPEELRRDDVPAAAGGERLDDLRVAPGDDEDGEHRGRRDEEGQDGVPPEGEVRLFRAVRGGGDPVRTQPHPGEEGDQGDVVEDLRVEQIAGSAQQEPLDALIDGSVGHRSAPVSAIVIGSVCRPDYTIGGGISAWKPPCATAPGWGGRSSAGPRTRAVSAP